MTDADKLPRLAYIGDVPIEATFSGSAVLHRLLQGYPANRLRVVETADRETAPDRRLPGVEYRFVEHGRTRWLNTRLFHWYSLWLAARAPARADAIEAALDGFAPDAILTLAHGSLWQAASVVARRWRLPLHVVVHDDRPWMSALPEPFGAWLDRRFGEVYRSAASRLCVSPGMVEEYERRHGAPGEVLYPSRPHDSRVYDVRGDRSPGTPFVVAYAGTTDIDGYPQLLRQVADALARRGGELIIFGPLTAEGAASCGLGQPNVRMGGLLPADELLRTLREVADVLYVPMSFAAAAQDNMRLSFPSKLTDYTSVGLPLLIQGPPSCSAVRWAQERDAASIVTSMDASALDRAIERLATDAVFRRELSARALAAGERDFSSRAAQGVLTRVLGAARARG